MDTLYPIETYTASTVDKKAYEVPIAKEVGSSFPYDTAEMMKKQGKGVISNTPFANVMTMQMAKLAVKNEELGKDDDTDFGCEFFIARCVGTSHGGECCGNGGYVSAFG